MDGEVFLYLAYFYQPNKLLTMKYITLLLLSSIILYKGYGRTKDSVWTHTCCAPVYRMYSDSGIKGTPDTIQFNKPLVDSLRKIIKQLEADKEELQWELAQERRGIDPGMDQTKHKN